MAPIQENVRRELNEALNKSTMTAATFRTSLRRWAPAAFLVVSTLVLSGCATDGVAYSPAAVSAMSPVAEVVGPLEAYHLAQAYVAGHPNTDFMIGSGNSMLPLYKDHTVIITERQPIADLKPGMTVVYVGGLGFPVAHVLVKYTSEGWIAMGVGNRESDERRVTADNYMGVVVKAFEPTSSPMLALIEEATAHSNGALVASNP